MKSWHSMTLGLVVLFICGNAHAAGIYDVNRNCVLGPKALSGEARAFEAAVRSGKYSESTGSTPEIIREFPLLEKARKEFRAIHFVDHYGDVHDGSGAWDRPYGGRWIKQNDAAGTLYTAAEFVLTYRTCEEQDEASVSDREGGKLTESSAMSASESRDPSVSAGF